MKNHLCVLLSAAQFPFPAEGMYLLHDPVGEAEIKCSLTESLRRARGQRLFGVRFVCYHN